MKKKILILFLFVFIRLYVFSQIAVTTNSVATTLAQNIVGPGITITNANLTCPNGAAGIFNVSGAASALGIPSGIILTTGSAVSAGMNEVSFASIDNGTTFSDPALTSVESGATNDPCILKFNFVPICSTVNIKFVFGSEEYPTFVGSIDDAFGIFLTGPNPAGGNYVTHNFATLPNGTPVSINNVNSTTNSSFYHDNTVSSSPMYNYLAYGGYTTVITASVAVTPCQTYTMEAAIADAGDHIYDSGVLIQANSVSCTNTPTVTTSTTAANCGNTGSATATVTNYTGTPTYQWLPGNANTPTISNLAAGTYTCLVGLQSGCGTTTQTVTAVVPSTGATFSYTPVLTNPSCFNGTNGSANINVSGGTAPYTYTWTTTPPQYTATLTNEPAGTYIVNVKDNTGCIGTKTITLTNPPAIVATVTTTPTTCTASIGTAAANVTSGGTAPYTYTWSTSPVQNNQTATGLALGSYSVIITDVNTCTATATGNVGGQTFSWTPSAAGTNPSCYGYANGTATVSITNAGSNTFTYGWTTSPAQTTSVTTASLAAGSYTAYVTDNNGCTSSASVLLTDPPALTATVTTSPTTCTASIGSATVNVSNGTAPYAYAWSTTPVQTASVSTNLAQGTYSVGVMDVNTCTAVATGTVGVQYTFNWTPTVSNTPPKCIGSSDGTATVTINNPGNSGPFGCVWNPTAQTNTVATGLSSGNYTVTVTDNNGCTDAATTTLTDPPPITATVNTTPTICTGSVGSATATVLSGGVAPYNYSWITTSPIQSGPVASNLAQGTYSVLVTDVNNCPFIFSGTVNSTGFTWVPTANTTPAKCFGSTDGSATVTVSMPGTYSYTWTPGGQSGNTASSLAPGTIYTVTVEDNNACISTLTTTVTQPTQIVANTQTSPAMCTAANGNAHAIATGGTPGYTYTWLTNPVQNTQNASGLTQGQHTVIVSDVNSCTATAIAIVGDTTDLTVTATQSPDLCSQGVGKAIAHPVGQSPYHYQWSTNPVDTNQIADSLQVGPYSVNVIDANGCTASASITVVNKNDILSSQFTTSPEGDIYAENQTVLTVSSNAGWSPDTAYLATVPGSDSIPMTTPSFTYVFPKYGDYTATYYYTSVHGCKDTVSYDIIVKDYITLYIPNAFTPNGDGKNDMFGAAGTFVNTFEMYIYDRWGVLVTKLDNINKVWDGTKNGGIVPEDTYVYKGTASDVFGKHITFKGQVDLIR